MSAALVGAVSCLRCAGTRPERGVCVNCGAPWPDPPLHGGAARAASGAAGIGLDGVVTAGPGGRVLAGVIDVLTIAVPVGLALVVLVRDDVLVGTGPTTLIAVGLFVLAGVILALQLAALGIRGRSLGRLVCRQRSVSAVTGSPIRLGRVLRQAGRGLHPLAADLRKGRADPLEPQLTPAPLAAPAPSDRPEQGDDTDGSAEDGSRPGRSGLAASVNRAADWLAGSTGSRSATSRPDGSGRRPVPAGVYRSVAILLDSGERYDLKRPLLIGRNPIDPDGRRDRVLLSWADLSRRLASTHLLLESDGPSLTVTDLHSEAGTAVIDPEGGRRSLQPGEPTVVQIGALIQVGARTIKVVPSG